MRLFVSCDKRIERTKLEANKRSLSNATNSASHHYCRTRARHAARTQCIKDRVKAEGLKPSHLSAREITSWAILYLEDNRAALLPDAIAQAKRMFLSEIMGKRAQKAFIEESKIEQSQGERSQSNG